MEKLTKQEANDLRERIQDGTLRRAPDRQADERRALLRHEAAAQQLDESRAALRHEALRHENAQAHHHHTPRAGFAPRSMAITCCRWRT